MPIDEYLHNSATLRIPSCPHPYDRQKNVKVQIHLILPSFYIAKVGLE